MAMVKCRECGHAVSTQAQKCPSCGVSKPAPVAVEATVTKFVLAVVIAVAALYACNRTDGSSGGAGSSASASDPAMDALWLCQYTIKHLAKNPSSAEVPYTPDHRSNGGHYFAWPLGSGLTMMNGFGAHLDTSAACTTNAAGTKITSLSIDGKTVL